MLSKQVHGPTVMSAGDPSVEAGVQRMIKREQEILDGFRRMRQSARNPTVRDQCESQISEASRNIAYLEDRLRKLTIPSNAEDDGKPPDKVGRLDLLRFDDPHMGARIQVMLPQLEYKLSIERQYLKGTQKLMRLYTANGDGDSRAEAESNLADSQAKIALLTRSLKRYSDMHLAQIEDIDKGVVDDSDTVTSPNVRRPLSGTLHVSIGRVENVDHTLSWKGALPDVWVTCKVDSAPDSGVRTAPTRSSLFNASFSLEVDKGNEVELAVWDQAVDTSDSEHPALVAVMWIRLSDLAEAIRRKRVQRDMASGWASAAQVQAAASKGQHPINTGSISPASQAQSHNAPVPPASYAGASQNPVINETSDPKVSGWFTLEPAGKIYLTLGFDKGSKSNQGQRLDRLGRHNAIRKHEEVSEVHGHELVHRQAYNIVRCSICGDFTTSHYQCTDCKLSVDRKCLGRIVTKCMALKGGDPDEELRHRIPHHLEAATNLKANWCSLCGYILPLGKKAVRKCSECSILCHVGCAPFMPNICGMTMEMASQIVSEIQSTRIRQATKAAAAESASTLASSQASTQSTVVSKPSSQAPSVQKPQAHPPVPPTPRNASPYGAAFNPRPPPPSVPVKQRKEPIRRKEVGSAPVNPSAAGAWWSAHPAGSSSPMTISSQSDNQGTPASIPPQQTSEAHRRYATPDIPEPAQASTNIYPETALASKVSADNSPAMPPVESLSTTVTASNISVGADNQVPTVLHQAHHKYSHSSASRSVQAHAIPQPKRKRRKVGLDDFSFLAVLGKGNFGKVMLAESKHTGHLYAVKVLKKSFIIENREVESTRSEKRVFLIANREHHPFLVNLLACFQTENRIYFVMDYISGGDLMYHIQKDLFSPRRAQFYAAEVLLALKHFHDNDVIYRDLKLDNILLTLDGHIKVADYGLCKEDMGYGKTTGTFCGTPDFIAPEILLDQKYDRSVDWWALGVLMYQMLLGKSPFHGSDEDEVYDAILSDEPLYPIHMPRDSVSILQQLLCRDPQKRLGSGPRDALDIMEHPYFDNIDFDALVNLQVEAPYKPEVESATDVRYFDREFTSEMPALTPMNSVLTPGNQEQFRGFSYASSEQI